MRPLLRNTLALLSLLLFAAVCVLWVRTYFVAVDLNVAAGDFRRGDPWTIELGNGRGMMWVRRYRVFGDGAPSRVWVERILCEEFSGDPPAAGVAVADAPVDRGPIAPEQGTSVARVRAALGGRARVAPGADLVAGASSHRSPSPAPRAVSRVRV